MTRDERELLILVAKALSSNVPLTPFGRSEIANLARAVEHAGSMGSASK